MCGIGGQLRKGTDAFFNSEHWLKQLRHRGPDHSSSFTDNNYQCVHTRLSITDPHSRSHQPMQFQHASSEFVLSFNGEIYNYTELREFFLRQGYPIQTNGDAEVILWAYQHFGLDFVQHLNGMFAISLWDVKKRQLILIRDRLGIKPLFYYKTHRSFYFCSDLKPLEAVLTSSELNPEAIHSVLKFRYNALDESVRKNVYKLKPGTILIVNSDLSYNQSTYWEIPEEFDEPMISNPSQKFYELLGDSVRIRSLTEASFGTFLSGGIDSSAITHLAAKHHPKLSTFTVDTGVSPLEVEQAQSLSDRLGLKNQCIEIHEKDIQLYSQALDSLSEPLGDSIIMPTWRLSQSAAKDVKVVLSGEGADEILGGYVHHLIMAQSQLLHKLFPWLSSQHVARLILKLPTNFFERFFPYPQSLGKEGVRKFTNFLQYFDSPSKAYLQLIELVSDESLISELKNTCSENKQITVSKKLCEHWNSLNHTDFLNQLTAFDLRFWNTNYTLARLDQLSMTHSLEARVPFLDHRLVEFSLSLPQKFKLKRFQQKTLLREAMRHDSSFPEENIGRRKSPFILPVEKFFSKEQQTEITQKVFESRSHLQKFVEPKVIDKLLQNAAQGVAQSKRMFNFYILALFLDKQT